MHKKQKLLSSAEYQSVFREATKFSEGPLTLLVRKNDRDINRLGLALKKRDVKKATNRNRIKRVIRESFRRKQFSIHCLDMVVLSKFGIETALNNEINHYLDLLWEELNAYYKS